MDLLEKNIATIQFSRENKKYYVTITTKENIIPTLEDNNSYMSIDLGVTNIATCYSNKINNIQIQNTRFKKLEHRIELIQSKMDKKKRYSRRYVRVKICLNRSYKKLSNKNKDFQHKVSKKLIDLCIDNDINTLVVGDIQTKSLVTEYNTGLNKSTQGRGSLGRFKCFLKYKAQKSGLNCKMINEAYTSQTNCLTGKRNLNSALGIREVELEPGSFIDRDLNSAVNILKRYRGKWYVHIQELTLDKMYLDSLGNLSMSKIL